MQAKVQEDEGGTGYHDTLQEIQDEDLLHPDESEVQVTAKRRQHITPYDNRLQWYRIDDRKRILTLSLLFKILATQYHLYLYGKYQFRTDVSSDLTISSFINCGSILNPMQTLSFTPR